MMFTCTLACLLFFIISPVISANLLLNCTRISPGFLDLFEIKKSNPNDYSVQFEFNKNNTKIHQYNGSSSVNVYVSEPNFHVQVKVPGKNKKLSFNNHGLIEVIGVANMVNTSDYKRNLTNCEFYVVNKASGRVKNDILYDVYEECLNLHLCQALGNAQKGNLVAPQGKPKNFDFIPVDYTSGNKHRTPITQLLLLKLDDKAQLDKVTTLITKNLAHDLKMRNSGSMELPRDELVLSASNVILERLDDLQKLQSSLARPVDGTTTSRNLSITFNFPDLRLIYNNVKLVKLVLSMNSICVDVKNMTFDALISLDVVETRCKAKLIQFSTKNSGDSKTHACHPEFLDSFVKYYANEAWNDKVIKHVNNYVEKVLSNYIEKSFGCD